MPPFRIKFPFPSFTKVIIRPAPHCFQPCLQVSHIPIFAELLELRPGRFYNGTNEFIKCNYEDMNFMMSLFELSTTYSHFHDSSPLMTRFHLLFVSDLM